MPGSPITAGSPIAEDSTSYPRQLDHEFAIDTRIQQHPIRIAEGRWTAVVGIMQGTFTQPMVLADGTVIAATGKPYSIMMATVGRWSNGAMDEEWLFWDNQSFVNQIGLGQ